eukprot:1156432-Pelagomonas_calceolata.AAC.6
MVYYSKAQQLAMLKWGKGNKGEQQEVCLWLKISLRQLKRSWKYKRIKKMSRQIVVIAESLHNLVCEV